MAGSGTGGHGRRERAGASAQAEYERRAAQDTERRQAGRRKSFVLIAVAPLVGYLAVHLGGMLLNEVLSTSTESLGADAPEPSLFDGTTLRTFGLWAALVLPLWVAAVQFGRRQSTEAWRIGAEGERRTGRILETLPDGFYVFHDLRMPNSRANIDHVVVGPAGVFTIETKNYAKGVVIKGGVARSNGRKLDPVVDQAKRQASAISGWLGTGVTPIVCVHGQGVHVEGWFSKPTVSGVRFCSGRRLTRVLTKPTATHSPEAVSSTVARLERR